ncbi:hypothetical protein CBM2587_P10001 [Cupriavidus taiwanensis]|uniref:Uncharacterized protein n=1 Tax=Cupriavidus taiwanensis TaxID=164546 RepID=A0A375CJU3_9BURK|nr:hypothetical protein CBM2587_P10001 [Cupriavidus taiwanensis]
MLMILFYVTRYEYSITVTLWS